MAHALILAKSRSEVQRTSEISPSPTYNCPDSSHSSSSF